MIDRNNPPRGVRNNNPGNLRHGSPWEGLAGEQTDSAFCTFMRDEDGLRALAKVLLKYERDGLNTVRGILNKYAPDTENDTEGYIAHVAARIGVAPGAPISVKDNLEPLMRAIVDHENGRGWADHYAPATYAAAIRRAKGMA
ncbi:MAG TPA: structural protein [Nitratidesulfovibrio sp.]|nr:structural protein [Nitratidesulfovibrio sp.]